MSQARVVISGTVESTPEKRFTPNNNVAVTNFNLLVPSPRAVGANADPNATFMVRVTCWRHLADAAVEQLERGDAVLVEGRLQIASYQTQEGLARKSFEIDAATLEKLPGLPQSILVGGAESGMSQQPQRPRQPVAAAGPQSTPVGSGYAPGAPGPVTAPQSGQSGMSAEDFFTEDDIPF